MSLPSTFRIDKLWLENFRCFSECELTLHPELTVLVADNGSGKTALLDALALGLAPFVEPLIGHRLDSGFERSDVRVVRGVSSMSVALPTSLWVEGLVDGARLEWSRKLWRLGSHPRTSRAGTKTLTTSAVNLKDRLKKYATGSRDMPPPLPVVAFYGTGRLWSEQRLTQSRRRGDTSEMGRTSGYQDCLSPTSSFKTFVLWYERTVWAIRNAVVHGQRDPVRPEHLLAAVRSAVDVVLAPTGWHALDWDADNRELVIEHAEHGRLPLSNLSDGVRNMVALVADLAHRCARLNPHFGPEAARLTPGVVLIDEVDMHLHPRWQQMIVELLRAAFPATQMIVSTHSPQVLSTVNVDSIRVIRHAQGQGTLTTPTFQTRGVESADVLATIMGVDPVPQVEEARRLSEYRALIEEGLAESGEALVLRARLLDHFGANHPVMLDCDRLVRFQAIKMRKRDSVPKLEPA